MAPESPPVSGTGCVPTSLQAGPKHLYFFFLTAAAGVWEGGLLGFRCLAAIKEELGGRENRR